MVHFRYKTDKINFVGTDTKRLAIYTLEKANNQNLVLVSLKSYYGNAKTFL